MPPLKRAVLTIRPCIWLCHSMRTRHTMCGGKLVSDQDAGSSMGLEAAGVHEMQTTCSSDSHRPRPTHALGRGGWPCIRHAHCAAGPPPVFGGDAGGQLHGAQVHLAPHAHFGYVRQEGLERARVLGHHLHAS